MDGTSFLCGRNAGRMSRGTGRLGKTGKKIRTISLNVRDNSVKGCSVLKVPWYFWRKRRFCAMTVACNTK